MMQKTVPFGSQGNWKGKKQQRTSRSLRGLRVVEIGKGDVAVTFHFAIFPAGSSSATIDSRRR